MANSALHQRLEDFDNSTTAISGAVTQLTTALNGTAATPGLVTAICEGSKAIASAIADPTTKLLLTTVIAKGAGKIEELLKALAAEHEVTTRLALHLEHATITADGALNSVPGMIDLVGRRIDQSLGSVMLPVLAQLGAISEPLGSIHRALSAQKEARAEPFETMKWYLDMLYTLEHKCRSGESAESINDACESVKEDARFGKLCQTLAPFGLAGRFKTLFRKFESDLEEERTERLSELFRLRQDLHRYVSFAG